MNSKVQLSFQAASELASSALAAQGASRSVANCVASALVLADADGQTAHGLSRVPSYVEQMHCRKVDGTARPSARVRTSSSLEIDARGGFAYPALDLAAERLIDTCKCRGGIVMAAIIGSHHCGVGGHPVERLARGGCIGLMFANTPKAMHVYGGSKPVFGTNPIAFACPRTAHDPIVVDLSLSIAARGKIVQAAEQGSGIPEDWGIDTDGNPSVDPQKVLQGSLNAIGGPKGSALAMMVEIMAGAFARSQFGYQASSFFNQTGAAPRVGQLLLCLNPLEFNQDFYEHVEMLIEEMLSEAGSAARIPGERRFQNRRSAISSGMRYPKSLVARLEALVSEGSQPIGNAQ